VPPAPEAEAEAPPAPESQPDGAPTARARAADAGAAAPAESDGRGTRLPSKAELRKQRSSPLVRNIAAEHGVDLAEVTGTGVSGRVTKRDILAHIESRSAATREPAPRPAATPAAPAPRPAAAPAAPTPPAAPAPPGAVIEPAGLAAAGETPRPFGDQDRVEVVPMSIMRKKIADHMIQSKRTSAHVTSFFEIDMSRVAELRRNNKPRFQADSGVNLTYMPFIIKAVVAGIQEWPTLNSSVWQDNVVLKKDINIGIAVALQQGKEFGLIVPVIRHADELSMVGLARAANDLAERARSKKLLPEEVQGGTFTITNPGVFGSMAGTPIINQPQVAILGVGAIEKRVKVVGPDDSIGVRTCAFFSISYDHRIVDGATADHFMMTVKETLEGFSDPSLK
jgi:2-oxoglutarate dehydrogenase E2 component (dihydrolipoamide succinyltransferase)